MRLRKLREARGWTQELAAESCGISHKVYQFFELGIKDNPSLRTLEKIARGFGLELHELLAPTLPRTRRGKVPGAATAKRKRKQQKPASKG